MRSLEYSSIVCHSYLSFGSLFLSGSAYAFQLQYRAYHSQAQLKYERVSTSTTWNAAFLNGPPQLTRSADGSGKSSLSSPGQEISLGTELLYPHLYLDFGIGYSNYFLGPKEKLEVLIPRGGLQILTNVQDRWMPYARVGLSQHRLKLSSQREENRVLPTSLGLEQSQGRFSVGREWRGQTELINGDLSLGIKLYPVPTTAIVLEYRYSQSLSKVTLRERETGVRSFSDNSGFVSEVELRGVSLSSQDFSLGIEVEL